MFSFESKGSFDKTERFLTKMAKGDIYNVLKSFADEGTLALKSATPVDSGITADAWYSKVINKKNNYQIIWCNSHVVNGAPVVILLQYGHGTGTGGYVQGREFINQAIQPIFDKISTGVWKAVTTA